MRRSQLSLLEDGLLLGEVASFSAFSTISEELLRGGSREVRFKLLVSEAPLSALLARATLPSRLTFSTHAQSREGIAFTLSRKYGGASPRSVKGSVSCARHPQHPEVWGMLTTGSTEFLRGALSEALFECHPRPAAPILRTPQIQQLLQTLAAAPRVAEARVRRVGARGHIKSLGASHTIERDRTWTDVSIPEAFSELAEAKRWAMDVQAAFALPAGESGRVAISRFSVFTYSGRAREAFEQLTEPAVSFASQWHRFLKGRGKQDVTPLHGKPFYITFDGEALGTREGTGLLLETLGRLPHMSCTVLHGNPYFHVALTDHLDGSSYELLSVSGAHLAVMPQGRATLHSLQRMCGTVFARFREGALQEIGEVALA